MEILEETFIPDTKAKKIIQRVKSFSIMIISAFKIFGCKDLFRWNIPEFIDTISFLLLNIEQIFQENFKKLEQVISILICLEKG